MGGKTNGQMTEFEMSGGNRKVLPPSLPLNHGKPLTPILLGERIITLDVVRGIALLGILISNMVFFSQPYGINGFRNDLWMSSADRIADWISMIFIEGKFYPIFSMLFGMGFALQMQRAASRGPELTEVYLRRLYILIGFGLLHGIFLWEGDVLLAYGLCGLLLLLFRNCKPRTVVIWALGIILIPALLMVFLSALLHLLSDLPAVRSAMNEMYSGESETRKEMFRVFLYGSYLDVMIYRIGELVYVIFATLIFSPIYLGLFLIGMLVGQKGILSEVHKHKRLLVGVMLICGVVGVAANYFGAWVLMAGINRSDYGQMLLGYAINSIFGPVLAFAYVAGLALMICRWSWAKLYAPFATVGRMALTNYLMQSLIATTIFYGYGFGYGGNIGRMGTIGLALVIYAAQIIFSLIWLKHFRYGPMEWLWRSLSYGARQPMALENQSTRLN
jgi:uncharacterized protein